jgi:hypothetical protein
MSTSGGDNRSSSLRRAASQPFLDGMEARFMERCEVCLVELQIGELQLNSQQQENYLFLFKHFFLKEMRPYFS